MSNWTLEPQGWGPFKPPMEDLIERLRSGSGYAVDLDPGDATMLWTDYERVCMELYWANEELRQLKMDGDQTRKVLDAAVFRLAQLMPFREGQSLGAAPGSYGAAR